MSDRDTASPHAWTVAPSAYLASRPPAYRLPAQPRSVYLGMHDGCRLAADIYLPEPSEAGDVGEVGETSTPPARLPTVVIFTPYYRRFRTQDPTLEPSPNCGRYRDAFVPHGYAVVVVDVRGTGASFGTRDALRSPTERTDYAEVAQWIVEQPWSDGVVGSTGISYLGAASVFLASTQHPAVKAIAPLFAVTDLYTDQLYVGGVLSTIWTTRYDELMRALDEDDRPALAPFAYYGNPQYAGPQPVDEDIDGQLLAQALQQHRNSCRLNDWVREMPYQHDSVPHDPALSLDACSPGHYARQIPKDVAIYSVSGWWDGAGYSNAAITRYLTLTDHPHRLLLGPWDHGARTNISPWREATGAQFPLLAEVLRFFDHHLRGIDTGLQHERPVHYFTVHGEQWQAADAWPPEPAAAATNAAPPVPAALQSTRWYANAQGALSPQPGASGADAYQVDFTVSAGTQTRLERLGAQGVDTYYPDWTERQSQYLHYTSAPLAQAMELTGHATAHVWITSSQADAAIYAYLTEVLADGSCRYVTEGVLRALHREGLAQSPDYAASWPVNTFDRASARLLTPGEPACLTFALLPISWMFAAGSHLRISIGGADGTHGSPVPLGRPPQLQLLRGGQHATCFDLPLRPVSGAV